MAKLTKEERRVEAIERGRARRAERAAARVRETEWFIEQVNTRIKLTVKQRVRLATELVKNKVIRNISRPVKKTVFTSITKNLKTGKTKRTTYTVVSDRSKPGEYPKADTTLLMKTIFAVQENPEEGVYDGAIGTPLDYGFILETDTRLNRSFLVRTLNESRDQITRILTGTIV